MAFEPRIRNLVQPDMERWVGTAARDTLGLSYRQHRAQFLPIRREVAEQCSAFERQVGTDDEPDRLPAGYMPPARGQGVWKGSDAPPVVVAAEWAP